REAVQGCNIAQRMDYWSKRVFDEFIPFGREEIGHHQDWLADARLPQGQALFEIAYGESFGARGNQYPRHFDCSMTISVRFDDRHHGHIGANQLLDSLVVACDLGL